MTTATVKRIDGRKGGRFYDVPEIGECPSVTNILSVIAKPALVPWAAKVERELVVEAAAALYLDAPISPRMTKVAYITSLVQRLGHERAHEKQLKQAGDIGNECHRLVEWSLRIWSGQKVGEQPIVGPQAATAFSAFKSWWDEAGLKVFAVEQTVWHPLLRYAGTLDLLAYQGDDLVLVDLKTSKAIYDEFALQVAAYMKAVDAMGHGPVRKGYIVRLPKTDGDGFETLELSDVDRSFTAFEHALALWRWQQKRGESYEAAVPGHAPVTGATPAVATTVTAVTA
jgi:hypothetical protein